MTDPIFNIIKTYVNAKTHELKTTYNYIPPTKSFEFFDDDDMFYIKLVNYNFSERSQIDLWLEENCESAGMGGNHIGFKTAADRTMFVLRWS